MSPDARFCASCGAATASPISDTATEMLKVVTILFADVVGSTARAEKMHPEDTRALMTDFFQAMREEIELEGGMLERIAGDGLMADFGIPLAHEDDPLRAVRTAEAMLHRLERWNADKDEMCQIQIRVGINTGEVSAAGSPGQDLLVTGDVVNVAARLEQAAKPGSIVIGERTARSIRGLFELKVLEPVIAKGKSEPVAAFEVIGPVSDAEGDHQRDAPLIGRDDELATLAEVFERCRRTRSPHLVTLLGDAGMGKSRLAQEFLEKISDEAYILVGNCISHGEGADIWPMREILGSAAGFGSDDSPAEVLTAIERLAAGLGLTEVSQQTVAALASTVGVEPESFARLDPRVRHREFLIAWRMLLSALAADRLIVVVVQDIHWAGELLLDIVSDLACRTEGPLLFLCPARPELIESKPDWGTNATNHVALRLKPLSEQHSAKLIASLIDADVFPLEQRELILKRCEGNPFFLQELVRHLMELGHLEKGRSSYRSTAPISGVDVPDTVHGVLLARIDRLDRESKRLGQQAAVVGRTFWESAVVELCGRENLEQMLSTLERRAFVTERAGSSFGSEFEYFFNHILIRDALYQTMPRRLRGASHEVIAGWIQEKSGERIDEHLQTIAHHYERAHELLGRDDLRIRAREYLIRASEDAVHRFAVTRAAELATKAVALSEGAAERVEALEIAGDQAMTGYRIDDAWLSYCEALSDASSDETVDLPIARLAAKAAIAATRFEGAMQHTPPAEEIRAKIDLGLSALGSTDADTKARCLLLTSKAFSSLGYSQSQQESAQEALGLAKHLNDPDLISVALDGAAFSFALSSDAHFGEMHDLQHRRLALVPRLNDLNEICDIYGSASWSSFFVGRHEDTIGYATECLRRAEGISPGDYQHALQWRVMANFRMGRWDEALRDQSELESLVLEEGGLIPVFVAGAFAAAFLCRELRGDEEAADDYLEMLTRLKVEQESAHEPNGPPRPATALALLHRGRIDDAAHWLDYGDSFFVSGLLLESRCELARLQDDPAAMLSFMETLNPKVSSMGMPTLTSYSDRLEGRLSQHQGDDHRADQLLSASAEGFNRLRFPWEEAMSRLLLAEHRLSQNDRQRAESEAGQALLIFQTLGSVKEEERTKVCLRRCGPSS